MAIVILANGNVTLLGDMYAFGLLGAFSVTSVCLDVVRWRERTHRDTGKRKATSGFAVRTSTPVFVIGVVTSFLVVLAWGTNLFAKPLATLFGGSATLVGLAVAGLTYTMQRRRGMPTVVPLVHRLEQLPHLRDGHPSVLVLLDSASTAQTTAIIEMALADTERRDLVLIYMGDPQFHGATGHLLEIIDPYLADTPAQDTFRVVQRLTGRTARQRHRHCIYLSPDDRTVAVHKVMDVLKPGIALALRDHPELVDRLPATGRHQRVQDGVKITSWTAKASAE